MNSKVDSTAMVGYAYVLMAKFLAITWLAIFTSLVHKTNGQAQYTLDQNEDAGTGIYVGIFQAGILIGVGFLCTTH